MRVLAVDYGDQNIGLAICDPLGISAQGLQTMRNEGPERVFEALRGICDEKKVEVCVVGLPLQMSGEIGNRAKLTLAWIEDLKKRLPCRVETWDERLSSKEAHRLMLEQGLSRKKQKGKSDQISAILILQNYLDARRLSG